MRHVQIGGPFAVAARVGHGAQRAGGRQQAAASQAVETIGQVHRVRRSDDDQHRQRNEPPAEFADPSHERHDQIRAAVRLSLHAIQQTSGDERDQRLPGEFHARAKALPAPRYFMPIVGGSDASEAQQRNEHDRDIMVFQIAQQRYGGDESGDDEQAAHRRRGPFVLMEGLDFGGWTADRLAKAAIEPADPARSAKQRCGEAHPGGDCGAQRDLAEPAGVGGRRVARQVTFEPTDEPEQHVRGPSIRG